MGISKTKVAIGSASAVLAVALLNYGANYYSTVSEERENTASGYTGQSRSEELKLVEQTINSQNSQARNLGTREDKYIDRILGEANWASLQLRIPRPFIIAQWLMESGNLDNSSIAHNNPGGIKARNGSGYELRKFGSLHSFGEEYVRVLRKDGAVNSGNFDYLINRLYAGHYFVGESRNGYANKVAYHLQLIRNAGSEHRQLAIAVQSKSIRTAQAQIAQRPANQAQMAEYKKQPDGNAAENPIAVWQGMPQEEYALAMRKRFAAAGEVRRLTRNLGHQNRIQPQQKPKPKPKTKQAPANKNNNPRIFRVPPRPQQIIVRRLPIPPYSLMRQTPIPLRR